MQIPCGFGLWEWAFGIFVALMRSPIDLKYNGKASNEVSSILDIIFDMD